jgi:hypothetical protein
MEAVPPQSYPRSRGSPTEAYPIQGATTEPFFPPVCLKTHWDPTMIYRKTVPTQQVSLPLDFRPWTRICMEYTTAGPVESLPYVPDSVVFPSGGEFYPPQRWSNRIDNESLIRRLDRPLGTCDADQFHPNLTGDMYMQRILVPDRKAPDSAFVSELAMPQVLIRASPYDCRAQADQYNMDNSHRLFNNPTKQDRYTKFKRANVESPLALNKNPVGRRAEPSPLNPRAALEVAREQVRAASRGL